MHKVTPRVSRGSAPRACCVTAGGACPRCDRQFRQLWQWCSHIRGLLRKHAIDGDSAEDAISETFLVAWRQLDCVPQEPDEARAWLFRTARYCLANISRRKVHQTMLVERLAIHLPQSVEAPVDTDRVDLIGSFLSLSSDDQQLLVLVGATDVRSSELAELLGCTEPAARLRLHRARKRLDRNVRT